MVDCERIDVVGRVGRLIKIVFLFVSAEAALGQSADFSASTTSGCFPLTVNFADASTGQIASWSWNFGNGNTSALQNPSAVYTAPGVYTVSLTISGSFGTITNSKTGLIVVHDYPSPNFSFDKNSGCTPLQVNFVDLTPGTSGSITSWNWVFGDGGTSLVKNPSHTYTSAGAKTVSLRVKNEFGCESVKIISPAIQPQGPTASFTASNTDVCQVPAVVQFTNGSTGGGSLGYLWDFGDGSTSTLANPSHEFVAVGIYNVVLTATDQAGCSSQHVVSIHMGNSGGLDFSSSSSMACPGQSISFFAQSAAPLLSRRWDFGNGVISTEANPSVSYAVPGTYLVTLSAQLDGKSCQSVVSKEIEISGVDDPSFEYESDCDYNITFSKTSISDRQEWYIQGALRSVDNTFTYSNSTPGVKNVVLLVYNSMGCSKRLEKNISIPARPVALFSPFLEQDCQQASLAGCAPFTVNLTNQTSSSLTYTSAWDFGDGTTSTLKNPSHIYTTAGTFTLSLTVTDSKGCVGTRSAKVTVANSAPTARFISDKTNVCAREVITFTDQSVNANFWCWDFGDGTTATGSITTHQYERPGTYTVKLLAKNAGCTATYEVVDLITVRDPYVNFTVSKTCADPFTVELANLSQNYTSLQWDFGDGNTSNQDVSSYTYATVGNYTIKLTGSNTVTSCVVEASLPVKIQKIKADFEVDNPKPCRGAPVGFIDKSDFATQWHWNFGNSNSSILQNPTTSYGNPGTFNVTLTATDSDGCADQKQVSIDVLNIIGSFDFQANSTCEELVVQFSDHSTGNPQLLNWEWDFGDNQSASEINPTHTYNAKGNYSVKLTLTNAEGTCSYIKSDVIRFTNPQPEFSSLKNSYCIGDRINLINNSINAESYRWSFGNGQTSTVENPLATYNRKGSYDIKLVARDQYGCEKSIEKGSFIQITKPDAAFEAFETSSQCPPLTTIFADKSIGDIGQWEWQFGDGNSSTLTNPANIYLIPGQFNVKLKVVDANGCKDEYEAENLVTVGGPQGSYRKLETGVSCTNQSVFFEADTKNVLTHRWDFGDGTVEDTKESNAQHNYSRRGFYSTALVLIDENGCEVVADGGARLFVNETPEIGFEVSAECAFDGEEVYLDATANEKEVSWLWRTGDVDIGSNARQAILFEKAGEHIVELRGTNAAGCTGFVSKAITVQGNISFVPNVFTPNNDGFNDYFVIKGIEESKWDVEIFNRWGEPVYKKSDYSNDWNGGGLSSGVYFYFISNSFCDRKIYKGDVTLVR